MTHRNVIYLKRSLMKILIQIWNEIIGFWNEKVEKKNWFCDFRPQKIIIFYRSRPNFWKTCQDSKKLPYHLLVGMFMDKVKNFCDHKMILWEMGTNLLTNGTLWSPSPASIRVNIGTQNLLWKSAWGTFWHLCLFTKYNFYSLSMYVC